MFKRKKRTTVPPQYSVPPMPPVKPPTTGSNAQTKKACCIYETPCGWCTKWDKKCDRKIGCNDTSGPGLIWERIV